MLHPKGKGVASVTQQRRFRTLYRQSGCVGPIADPASLSGRRSVGATTITTVAPRRPPSKAHVHGGVAFIEAKQTL